MIRLIKGTDTKILSNGSSLIEILLKEGWTKEEKKEEKHGVSRTSRS